MLSSAFQQLLEDNGIASTKTGETTDRELKIAVAAMLYSIAVADQETHSTELNKLCDIISTKLETSPDEACHLVEIAAELNKKSEALDKLSALLLESFSPNQRQTIFALCWKVVRADSVVMKCEAEQIAILRAKLGLSLEQAAYARTMVDRGEW